jgi:hypothetical protein
MVFFINKHKHTPIIYLLVSLAQSYAQHQQGRETTGMAMDF